MVKGTVLFVDDEPKVLQGLRRTLRGQRETWDMSFAVSAAEATSLLAEQPYDVVVLDVGMPGKSGMQLLPELKADPRTRDVEIVVLTGIRDQTLKRQALDLGATDLLAKPVPKEELVARLRSAMRAKAYRDELRTQKDILEQQLLQSQKMELVGTLAAQVVHDLNNVLTSILGYADLTAHALTDPELRENLNRVRRAGTRAKGILDQILSLVRPREPHREPCDLALIVEECLELLHSCVSSEILVEWERPAQDHLVEADTTQMFQVVMNLCTNACQAMARGGTLRISLSETQLDAKPSLDEQVLPGHYHRLEVSDTGNGIHSDTLQRLFDPFYTTKQSQGGTGLGLSVVRRIVQNHGGLATVESTPSRGSTFYVYLPCLRETAKTWVFTGNGGA